MPYKDPEKRREHHRLYMRKWYRENQEAHVQRVARWRAKMRQRYEAMKRGLSCSACGEDHPGCIQFHHREGTRKEFDITIARRGEVGVPRMLAELEKCDVLCANCHLKLHWAERHGNETTTPPT